MNKTVLYLQFLLLINLKNHRSEHHVKISVYSGIQIGFVHETSTLAPRERFIASLRRWRGGVSHRLAYEHLYFTSYTPSVQLGGKSWKDKNMGKSIER